MSVLSATTEKKVEEILVQNGFFSADKLQSLAKEAENKKSPLFAFLIKQGYITDEDLTNSGDLLYNV